MKKVVSTFFLEKLLLSKNFLNLSYQALGAYLRPYNALFSLKTWLDIVWSKNLSGCST